ncbi:hypothetical protein O181_072963 [Austropuccinia psidii MF-1]|uniref:Uncharacterized protein n=1 Tax=Austropuccinia psidii MF-1 TaxID=1389203 RepID=A0A9Q3F891_9BASI|nr:hypothetical protein [Austropuccinia psidii MF-1]
MTLGFISKVIYSSTKKSFKDNWKKLQKQVKNTEVFQYLENAWLPLKEYYVPAWTNHHCHWGVGSTSRVEGAHDIVKLWLQNSTCTLLEVVRALHMELRETFIEIINRISKEMIDHVKNFPPHICALNGKMSHYALQIAFENFKTKFPPNEKCSNKYNNYQEIPCKNKTQKKFSRCQRLEISDFHPQWHLNLPTGFQGDYQSVEKERKNEAKKIFEDIGEDLFQRPMAEITPILQHFQDSLTEKVPFDQIPKSHEDNQYYKDPLECKNIYGRPQGARIKKREPSIFEIIESQSKRRGRPPSKVTSTTTSRSQSNVPSPIMEVDSSENSEDSEASLSKSISSSDSRSSETELNKSEVTLRRSRILAIGSKTSQRRSHKPSTSLKIYDAIYLNCEHCQSNYHTSDKCPGCL